MGASGQIFPHMFLHPGPDIVLLYPGQSLGCGGMGMGYFCVAMINDLLWVSLREEVSCRARHLCVVEQGVLETIFNPVSELVCLLFRFCNFILKFLCLVMGEFLRVNIVSFPGIRWLHSWDKLHHGLYGCNSREHVSLDVQFPWVAENRGSNTVLSVLPIFEVWCFLISLFLWRDLFCVTSMVSVILISGDVVLRAGSVARMSWVIGSGADAEPVSRPVVRCI